MNTRTTRVQSGGSIIAEVNHLDLCPGGDDRCVNERNCFYESRKITR